MGKTKTVFVGEASDKAKTTKRKTKNIEPAKGRVPGLKGGERIKIVSGELDTASEAKPEEKVEIIKEKDRSERKGRGKKYLEVRSKADRAKLYGVSEAVGLVKEMSYSKFDGSVEMHAVIKKEGFNTRVELPYSTGKKKKVEVANDETIKKLKAGKIDFDILLATAEMMPKIVPFAKLLGPKGMMPNPKSGTLIKTEKDAEKFSAGAITIKTEKAQPVIHTVVGKVSQKNDELGANIGAVIDAIGAKQIIKAYLCASMSPSVKMKVG